MQLFSADATIFKKKLKHFFAPPIPFNKLPCFVPSFEPTNNFPIIIERPERNREVMEDVMDEEIDENDEDYGNMGCRVLKGGIQNLLDF